jgi:hypothetical protein
MLDPSSQLSDIIGRRPEGFAAREVWMREAAHVVGRDMRLDRAPSFEPSMDDLGLEL